MNLSRQLLLLCIFSFLWQFLPISSLFSQSMHSPDFASTLNKAQAGNAMSQFLVSRMYMNGEGVEKNEKEAFRWLKAAADQKLVEAVVTSSWVSSENRAWALSEIYIQDDPITEANRVYGKSSDDWFGPPWKSQDIERLHHLIDPTNSEFNPNAVYAMGRIYEKGMYGFEESNAKALKCYQLAMEKGHQGAICRIGLFYADGKQVQKDTKRAYELFLKAAKLNDARAQYELGRMYIEGSPIEQNKVEGYKWLILADHNAQNKYIKEVERLVRAYEGDPSKMFNFLFPPRVTRDKEFYNAAWKEVEKDKERLREKEPRW